MTLTEIVAGLYAKFGGSNLLLNGAVAPASLAGGIAILNGTAPSANVVDQVSLWAGDHAAGQANLFVRGENGGTTKLGSVLHIDSVYTSSGQQIMARSGGAGAAALGSFGSGNQAFSFGAYFNGSAWTADSTRAFLQEVGDNIGWYHNVGLTAGNPVGAWSPAYAFVQVVGGTRFVRFGVGTHSAFGSNANNVVSIANGTAPGSSPADAVQLYSADRVAGQAGLRIRSENGSIIHLGDLLVLGTPGAGVPALKPSSTVMQARLGDDSDFAPLQGRLRSHAAASAETPTATHTLRIFDSGGTEYRVLAIAV